MFWVHLYATHQTMLVPMSHLMSKMHGDDHRFIRTLLAKEGQQVTHWLEGKELDSGVGTEPPDPRRFTNNPLYPQPSIFPICKMTLIILALIRSCRQGVRFQV